MPENGYGNRNGQTVFTHGVEFGVTRSASRDLMEATDAFLRAIAQGNPNIRTAGDRQATRVSGRTAITVPLVNPSPLGGQERVTMTTVFLAEGSLFYVLTVVPEKDVAVFEPVFRQIAQSIKLTDIR